MAKRAIGVKIPPPWLGGWVEGEATSNPIVGPPDLLTPRAWPNGVEDFGRRSIVDYQDMMMWRARGPFIAHPLSRYAEYEEDLYASE